MMNAQQVEQKPVVKRESKNKIRVDFERTPLKERLKARFLNPYFLGKIVWWIFRMVLMAGISYIVLFPFVTKIAGSFMTVDDLRDQTVRLISKDPSLEIYRALIEDLGYWVKLKNTFVLSFTCAILQTLVCALIGYGFAKFKFKGRDLIFMLVMLTMIVPHQTLQLAMIMKFQYFDIFGIIRLLNGGGIEFFGHNIKELGAGVATFFENIDILPDKIELFEYTKELRPNVTVQDYKLSMKITEAGIDLTNKSIPLILLSLGGLAFKNGLYIFLLRQFFRGIPDELEESAYMDGSGTFRTFVQIILPLSVPMLITVFMFAFCWQWTDSFYIDTFFTTKSPDLLVKLIDIPESLKGVQYVKARYESVIKETARLLVILPLVVLYSFGQKFLVQGIEQSGLAN